MIIYKKELALTGIQTVLLPVEAEIISLQIQKGVPCIWYSFTEDEEEEEEQENVTLVTMGTGETYDPFNKKLIYIGTYQLHGGNFVGHVFKEVKL